MLIMKILDVLKVSTVGGALLLGTSSLTVAQTELCNSLVVAVPSNGEIPPSLLTALQNNNCDFTLIGVDNGGHTDPPKAGETDPPKGGDEQLSPEELSARVKELEGRLVTVNTDLGLALQRERELKLEAETLETKLGKSKDQNDAMATEIMGLRKALEDTQSELETKEDLVMQLDGDFKDAQSKIEILETALGSARNDISGLRTAFGRSIASIAATGLDSLQPACGSSLEAEYFFLGSALGLRLAGAVMSPDARDIAVSRLSEALPGIRIDSTNLTAQRGVGCFETIGTYGFQMNDTAEQLLLVDFRTAQKSYLDLFEEQRCSDLRDVMDDAKLANPGAPSDTGVWIKDRSGAITVCDLTTSEKRDFVIGGSVHYLAVEVRE